MSQRIIMPPQKRGDTINGFTIQNIKIDDVDIDIDNYSIRMQVRDNLNNIILEYNKGTGIDKTSENSIYVNSFIINDLGNYKYDLQFTNNQGVVKTWFFGDIKVLDDVTR
jgi:hypothetical protein